MAIFDVPNGCIKKSSTRIAQVTPTMVELCMSCFTIERLMAVRTSLSQTREFLPLNSAENGLSGRQNTICDVR